MKKINSIWVYLIGTLIFFGILVLFANQIFIPRVFNQFKEDKFTYIEKPEQIYINKNVNYLAKLTTTEGEILIDLFEVDAPKNVNNFIYLSKKGYYNNVYFHRKIPNLLLQGGDRNTLNEDPGDDGYGKTPYYIEDELNWKNIRLSEEKILELKTQGYVSNNSLSSHPLENLSVAMANNGPNTNSSQFFIIISDGNDTRIKELNGRFTVIGKIVDSLETINKIKDIPVDDPQSNLSRPAKKIQIINVEILEK